MTTLEIRRAKNALNEISSAIYGYKWIYLWIDRSFFELSSLCMAIICCNTLIENWSIEFSNDNYFTSNEKIGSICFLVRQCRQRYWVL